MITICMKGSDELQELRVSDGDIILIDEVGAAYRFSGSEYSATTDPDSGKSCLYNHATNNVMYLDPKQTRQVRREETRDAERSARVRGGGGGGV